MSASVAARLRAGEQLVGTFVQVGHRIGGEVAGALGFDLVCVDGEHSVPGPVAVTEVVAGAQVAGCPCLVRVASGDPVHVGAALDAGAAGVIVPRVDSAAAAARAVDAARYPPRGSRGAGPSRATGYGRSLPEYLRSADDELLVAVQAESAAAVANAAEIAAVDGVDLVFVGPGDLAVSLAGAQGFADAELDAPIETVLAAARGAGRATGIFAFTPEAGAGWVQRGVGLVLVASDLGLMADGARRALGVLGR